MHFCCSQGNSSSLPSWLVLPKNPVSTHYVITADTYLLSTSLKILCLPAQSTTSWLVGGFSCQSSLLTIKFLTSLPPTYWNRHFCPMWPGGSCLLLAVLRSQRVSYGCKIKISLVNTSCAINFWPTGSIQSSSASSSSLSGLRRAPPGSVSRSFYFFN